VSTPCHFGSVHQDGLIATEPYFQPRLPCDPTNLVRFRQALGEAGVEELLAATIAAAVQIRR
jgi:hypothetical protein